MSGQRQMIASCILTTGKVFFFSRKFVARREKFNAAGADD
jgi:hypothetical protein